MDSHLLLAEKRKEGILHKRAADGLGRLLEQRVELLDVVASADAEELKNRLVVLEGQDCLVAYSGVSALK